MNFQQAYDILAKHQLLDNPGSYADVFDIKIKYEKFRRKNNLSPRIKEVLEACDCIELSLFELNLQGIDKYSTEYSEMIGEMSRKIIVQASVPLPRFNFADNPQLVAFYKKNNARTHKQKIRALERELGKVNVYSTDDWREPKWKKAQMKERNLALIFLEEIGAIPLTKSC